jgi:hypothetical protein
VTSLESKGIGGFITCTVDVPDMKIPPLPLIVNGKQIYPVGQFQRTFVSIELANAIKFGVKITKIDSAQIYLLGNPLQGYRTFFTNLKNEASTSGDVVSRTA